MSREVLPLKDHSLNLHQLHVLNDPFSAYVLIYIDLQLVSMLIKSEKSVLQLEDYVIVGSECRQLYIFFQVVVSMQEVESVLSQQWHLNHVIDRLIWLHETFLSHLQERCQQPH